MADGEVKILKAGESADEAKQLAELLNKDKQSIVTLGSRALLDAFFVMNGMDAKSSEIRNAVSGLLTDGESAVKDRLINDVRMLPCKAETLLDFISGKGSATDTLFAIERYCGITAEFDAAADNFKAFVLMLLIYGVPAERILVDLSYSGSGDFSGTVFRYGDISGGFK